jgi:hypothetical protein
MKLVELMLCPDKKRAPPRPKTADHAAFAEGLTVWKLEECDLLIIDDVDIGLTASTGDEEGHQTHLIHPERLAEALKKTGKPAPLAWLSGKRSVWVIGDASEEEAWRATIAQLIGGLAKDDIALVRLSAEQPAPLKRAEAPPSRAAAE